MTVASAGGFLLYQYLTTQRGGSTQPSIIVTSPNGGETWTKGQQVKILWNTVKEIKSVNIRLVISGNEESQNFNAAIASDVSNTGYYEWTVQDLYAEVLGINALPASDKYILTIEDKDHNNIYDMSDAPFSIIMPQTDVTTDWKTYTNTQYGLEVKYPSSWSSPFGQWAGGWTAGEQIDNNNYCVVDVISKASSNQTEIADLLSKEYVQTSIKIGGLDGIRLTRSPSGAGLTEVVYFSNKDANFRIGRNRGSGDKIENECINTFNQILSTFKFTK